MSADLNTGAGGASPPPTPVDPRLAQVEAERDMLNTRLAEANAIFETISPHQDLIKELIEDQDLREIYEEAKRVRSTYQQQQKPVPAELQPMYNEVRSISEYVNNQRKREEETQRQSASERAAREKAWEASASTFIRSLNASNPGIFTGNKLPNGDDEITDDGLALIKAVGAIGAKYQISFEEAYRRIEGSRYLPRSKQAPPSSLPVDAGNVGIPAQAKTLPEGNVDFVAELERRIAAGATS